MGDKLGYYRALADHGPSTPARAGRAHRHRRALRPGVAQRAGRRRLRRRTTRRPGTYTLPPEHAVALTDEDSPAFLPGFFQIALGTVRDASHDPRGGPQRRRLRLARAQHRRARRLRAVLPPRLPRAPGRRVAAGARRRRRQARAGRDGRRRRLRARRLDDPDGAGVPGLDLRRLGLPPPSRSRPPASGPRRPGSPTGSRFEVAPAQRVQRHRLRPGDHVRLPARHGRPGRRGPARARARSPPTAPGWSSSRWPATASRTTSTRSAAPTTASRRCCARRRRCPRTSGWRSAPRPVRPGSATSRRPAASPGSRRVAETPFNKVFEVRP